MTHEPDEVLYHFKPVNDGDFMMGVPARDLVRSDLDDIWPSTLTDALTPGPSGKALYIKAGHKEADKPAVTAERDATG